VAARPLRAASLPPALVALVALWAALVVGALMAASVPLGIGLLTALCYGPLVLLNLPVGIAIWVGVIFVEHLPAVSIGPTAAGLLIVIAWVGTLRSRREAITEVVSANRRLLGAVALFLVWLSLSAIWAQEPPLVGKEIWVWCSAGLALLIVATTIATPAQVRLLMAAFVAGAALSVAIGIVEGGLHTSATAIETATFTEGRLQGGVSDPNYLAAGLVPAIVLAGVLLSGARDPILRWVLAVTIVLLGVGLAATQSRGGLVAAVVTLIASVVIFRRKLFWFAALTLSVLAVGAWFTVTPDAWERVTSGYDGGGTGRTELWEVGWRILGEHPTVGVGLNNFRAEAYRYVRRPGNLEYVRLIAERPDKVHNVYLQMLVETGVVGLLLFLAVVIGCLRAGWVAARRFEELGQRSMAEVSRGVVVASLAMLVAAFFLSNGADSRMWILLALGPALLVMVGRARRGALRLPRAVE
jgi:O-antigen ligase